MDVELVDHFSSTPKLSLDESRQVEGQSHLAAPSNVLLWASNQVSGQSHPCIHLQVFR